jgi:Xaa-Pro dipeptidase
MQDMSAEMAPIGEAERGDRCRKAQGLMRDHGIDALYLDASVNLLYFTGVQIRPSERLHGAILPQQGAPIFISPAFEEPALRARVGATADIRCWEEDEDPTALVVKTIGALANTSGSIALDPNTPFFTVDGLTRAGPERRLVNGNVITSGCRVIKSAQEIALLKRSNEICLEVHKAVARVLSPGISTLDVRAFVTEAFRKLGAVPTGGSMVVFGEATAYPHGVPYPQTLQEGDMVLVDMSAELEGYRSDITRSYVFGQPTPRQREVWNIEHAAEMAGFAAAQPGAACESIDYAARAVLERAGFGPGYALPGLPHRTGHGIGLEVHEEAYIVKGNKTPLAPGMCFTDEPTICIYGEFGIRLEDCVYMTESGPEWFTQPSASIDDPFGYETA